MKTEGKWTALADVAIDQKLLCKIKAGSSTSPAEVVICAAGDVPVGITEFSAAADDEVTIEPVQGGTREVTALSALAVGAEFQALASGKIGASVAGPILGTTKEAALADDDIIEVIFY
jgi:hypothetical protein